MIEKIISGGQTGVDQAALNNAVECGISIGGWCPLGGLDENGKNILELHPSLIEATTSNPDERTQLNIINSDGTLIIVPSLPLPNTIKDGTIFTITKAKELNKPHLVISLTDPQFRTEYLINWCESNEIHILNIAGPRESSWPGIYQDSCNLFQKLFQELQLNLNTTSQQLR